MTPLRLLARRLRFLFRRGAAEREMAEEMRFHLEMRTEDGLAGGLPADEARHAANRKFGNLGMVQAKSRDQFVFQWLEQLLQDVSYSARTLRKNKGYSIVALLTLGLGIGVNTTAFTVLNRLLLRPAPFADTQRPRTARKARSRRAIFLTCAPRTRRWITSPPIMSAG
jgi:hypothetical protein